jgi:glutaconyl-CoA/methylmalonyl-CoA decarboxylase subunit gamma
VARYFLRLGDREVEADLEETPEGLRVFLDGDWHNVRLQRLGDGPGYVLVMDDRLVEVLVSEAPQAFNLQIGGRAYEVETVRRRPGARREEADQFVDGRWVLRAPLTGVVVEVRVALGDVVVPGDVLLVVEAMKMLNELLARVPGAVAAVNAEPGQRVEIGTLLVEINEQA